jgi:hypothetical protein
VRHLVAFPLIASALALAVAGRASPTRTSKVVDEQRVKLEELGKGPPPKSKASSVNRPARKAAAPLETQKRKSTSFATYDQTAASNSWITSSLMKFPALVEK